MASAGDMRDRIAILARSATPGQYGGVAETWTTAATTWAQVITAPPSADVPAGREIGPVRVAFRLRTRSDVSTANRIQWQGRQYAIGSIEYLPGGDRSVIVLHTHEVI